MAVIKLLYPLIHPRKCNNIYILQVSFKNCSQLHNKVVSKNWRCYSTSISNTYSVYTLYGILGLHVISVSSQYQIGDQLSEDFDKNLISICRNQISHIGIRTVAAYMHRGYDISLCANKAL